MIHYDHDNTAKSEKLTIKRCHKVGDFNDCQNVSLEVMYW